MADYEDWDREVDRAYEEGRPRPRHRPRLVGGTEARRRFKMLPAELPDPETIPPREWLYGTQLIRGFVTVCVAPGGVGKSSWALAVGMALATGWPILGTNVVEQVNVSIINLDDPMNELNRRVAALMRRHNVTKGHLAGRYFLNDREHGLTMAELGEDGMEIIYPDEAAVIEEIAANHIGVLICDPYAESHSLEENSNPHMIKSAAAWRRVASVTNCAIVLIHHVRKGDVTSIDSARGAKALTDSARVGLLLHGMSEQEAIDFDIKDDDRWQYLRLDDAKRNMAPARSAQWFRMDSVSLGNTKVNSKYPSGDDVGAIIPWKPTTIWQKATVSEWNAVLDKIARGPAAGQLYAPDRRGGALNWAGYVVTEMMQCSDEQAKMVIDRWLKEGTLQLQDWVLKSEGKERKGVVVVDARRPQ